MLLSILQPRCESVWLLSATRKVAKTPTGTWPGYGRSPRKSTDYKRRGRERSIRNWRTISSGEATIKRWNLSRVQLDNQLLINDRLHLFPRRNPTDFAFETVAINRHPVRHGHNLSQLQITGSELPRFWFVLNRDFVTGLHVIRSNIHGAAVDLHVTVGN